MSGVNKNRSIGIQRNKLLRYQKIKELYNESVKAHPHTPLTKILEIYIYPVYPISRTTLYQVLFTSITSELRNIEAQQSQMPLQTRLF